VLATRRYVAGGIYTIADITALVDVDFTSLPAIEVKLDLHHLRRRHDEVSDAPAPERSVPRCF
jgi:glutathione S-transferase